MNYKNFLKNKKILVSQKASISILNYEDRCMFFERNLEINNGLFDFEFIGSFSKIGGGNSVITHTNMIGRFCTIDRNVSMGMLKSGDNFLSTSHIFRKNYAKFDDLNDFYSKNEILIKKINRLYYEDIDNKKIIIGHDVWIGEGAVINRGVNIGHGAILRPYSVVYMNIPPYAIVEGNPAKIIGYRFSLDIIQKLLNLRWWSYDISILDNVDFHNIDQAIDQIAENLNLGVYINADNCYKISQKECIEVDFPNYSILTDNKYLPVKIKIGDYKIELDFNNHHERNYILSEQNKKLGIDALLAEKFIYKNDKVLDAGSNIGYTCLHYLLNYADIVYAFEPVVEHYARLTSLKSEKLMTYNLALGDKNEKTEIFLSVKHRQGSTLKKEMINLFPNVFGNNIHKQVVDVVSLDSFLPDINFNFIKVDVEGAEIDFLRGSRKHLEFENLRILQIELYPSYFDEAHDILMGYFSYCYRVGLKFEDNSLIIINFDSDISNFKANFLPPMYIYSKNKIL